MFICPTTTTITADTVSSIISMLDSVNVCYGSVPVPKFPNSQSVYGSQYEVVNGNWKHVNCSKILLDSR